MSLHPSTAVEDRAKREPPTEHLFVAARSTRRDLAVFVAFCVLVAWKHADLLGHPAPYFEDGVYLFAGPRTDPGFSLRTPMGGGYLVLFPRALAVLVAALAPLRATAAVFVVVSLLLKALCAEAIYLFCGRSVGLGAASALAIAVLGLFVQSANFTLDTLVISSIWNLTAIAFVAVFVVHRVRPMGTAAATALIAVAILSTVANVAIAIALMTMIVLGPSLPSRRWLYAALLALVGAYFVFGIHYEKLSTGTALEVSSGLGHRWRTFERVLFERSFVEAVLGRRARDLLVASRYRDVVDTLGTIALEGALIATVASAWRRDRGFGLPVVVAVVVSIQVLSLLVVLSGRYHDSYGAAQHYYLQSLMLLALVGVGLARLRFAYLMAFAASYLAIAAWSLSDIRLIAILGTPAANHRAFDRFVRRYEAGTCGTPCVLDTPAIWAPPWSIRLGP